MSLFSSYSDTLHYLYQQLPMFSKTGKGAIKKDLTNIRKLCEALGNPHLAFKSIHIAGTNGKGSTSHLLAAVLQNNGYKTGLYTSPHLIDFRERFRIDGERVSEDWVINFVNQNRTLIETIQPSFFEVTVAMAFTAFAEAHIDIAVVETGLGGKLDSTNIITPLLSVITNVSYDHQDVLGTTLPEIAKEKAGIIKPNVPVLIGEEQPETERVFFETSMRCNSKIYYAQPVWDLVKIRHTTQYQFFKAIQRARREMFDLKTDLLGSYQQHNLRTVLAVIEILNTTALLQIDFTKAIDAMGKVKMLTHLRGRWELLNEEPLIIADVAHNTAGIGEVMKQWEKTNAHRKKIVIGFVKDKDIANVLPLLPKDNEYYFCNADIPRALPANELKEIAGTFGLQGHVHHSVEAAVTTAKKDLRQEDALLITGSFFIVGEAIQALEKIMRAADISL